MEHPRICLIMLNWNGRQHLEYSIPSVLQTQYSNYEFVVVDNASQDGSVALVQQNYPVIRTIVNQRNLGWSAANNIGVRYAIEHGAEWVVLVNNDILVDPRWLRDAVKAAESDPRIGLVGFDVFGEFVKTPRGQFYSAQSKYDQTSYKDTSFIVGCALMVKVDVFRKIGLFDEIYFMYAEEDDFEFRSRSAGYRMIRTNIPIWHYSEGSVNTIRLRSSYLSIRNWLRLRIKTENYGIARALQWTARTLIFSCSPFVKVNRNDAPQRRYRPSTPLVNFWIVLAGFGWNLLHFSQTLQISRREREKVLQARQQWVVRSRDGLARPVSTQSIAA